MPIAGAVVLIGSALSMAATFRHTVYNVSPQASFGYLLAICLLIDLGHISVLSAVVGTAVVALLAGLFCLLPSDDLLTGPGAVTLLMLIAPMAAILYGPATILSWLATESSRQSVSVALANGTGPIRVEIVNGTGPTGARG